MLLGLVRELLAAGHTLADLRGLSAELAAELLAGAADQRAHRFAG